MDILLNDADRFAEILNRSNKESFTEEEEQQICQIMEIGNGTADFKRINIGPGADVYVLLTTLKVVAEVAGGIVAVAEIIKKFGGLVTKLKEYISRRELESIDEEGAKILAMDYIIHHFECDSLELVSSNVTPLFGGGSYVEYEGHPITQTPHRYYVFSYRLDNYDTVVLGITSSGEIKIIKAFEFNPYGITEIKDDGLPEEAKE